MREPCWKAPYQYPDARQIGGCPCQPAVCKGRCRGASPARSSGVRQCRIPDELELRELVGLTDLYPARRMHGSLRKH